MIFSNLGGMGVNKEIILITTGLIAISLMIILAFERKFGSLKASEYSEELKIVKTWELPDELEEISGFSFISENQVACIQDEDGIIFIYNLQQSKIEKEIDFSDSGDYEGIAIKGTTAYVLESDGDIYRVENYMKDPNVSKFETRLSSNHDVEGLCFDKTGSQLYMAIKEEDPVAKDYKGIYAFDLTLEKVLKKAAYKLNFDDKIFKNHSKKKKQERFKPSEIAVHPLTGDIYITEGEDPQLLILTATGSPKALYKLNKKEFPQPEGIAFDASGNLYISNERQPGTIHHVILK